MNEANESSNVVNLSQRLDPSSGRGGDLLNAVRNISSRRLQQYVGNMFEHVDDALFDLAEKAENNAAQMHYFDGMREVRKRRPVIERGFLALVSRELNDFAGGNRSAAATPTPSAPPAPIPGSVELSLVADNELEESLAITSMIGKNETRLSRDLFAVNQRLSVICGGTRIEDTTNPIGPALLAQAFRQAMRELSADMRVKLIIYKLFDRYVMSALEELYQEVNAELMRAGVLPQLRHEVVRNTAGNAGAAAGQPAAAGEVPQPLPADDSEASAELLQTLRTLFSARRGHPAAPLGTIQQGPLPTANELIGALSVLQSQAAMTALPVAATSGASAVDIAEQVLHLKEQLFTQLGSLRGQRPGQIATIDEDTIDLVGMLFEFILEDRNLPSQMQVMLARLQIPYLKAAILDRKLFAHRQHPARRLLDGLAEAAKSWSEESDRDGRLHDTVKAIVERLLQEFDDDMTIFDRLSAELQQFQESNRRRAELAEQRVAESTRGREKLEQARRRAAREILNRIGDHTLPPLIHGVLSRAWANYLVLTILRKGEESNDFREAVRFVDAFIASTKPVRTPEAKRDLRQLLPGIERALRKGLANVAFQEADIEKLLAQLHTYYRQQLGDAAVLPEQQSPAAAPAPLPIPESIQPIAESVADLEDDPASAEPAEDTIEPEVRDKLEHVKTLKPGTWLEFSGQDEHFERAKLSWVSPMSGRYLFVNRRGLKVGDYSPYELAMVMTEGRARILASNALFDRAMDAIVDRLSHEDVRPGESP